MQRLIARLKDLRDMEALEVVGQPPPPGVVRETLQVLIEELIAVKNELRLIDRAGANDRDG